MNRSAAHRRHWQERLAREQEAGVRRLEKALPAASRCAEALQARWPMIVEVWLYCYAEA